MSLTPAQLTTLKAHIVTSGDLNSIPMGSDGNLAIAGLMNAAASPAFWVWRTNVSRAEIYTQQNDLAVSGAQTGFWNWTTYKNQSAVEQNAWTQMFMGDQADFSKQNLRDGVGVIFTGTAAATAQANHILAIARRNASRAEKLFASGTGSIASPAVLTVIGSNALTASDVDAARNLP